VDRIRASQVGFHPLRVGDEVGRGSAVELHPSTFEGGVHGLASDGDDLPCRLFPWLGDDVADGLVVVGGDGADLGDSL